MWKRLYNTLEIVGEGNPLPKPEKQAISDLEKELHFKFPREYRKFLSVFGAGLLGGDILILSPGYPDHDVYDLKWRYEAIHINDDSWILKYKEDSPEFIRRIIPFATSFGGDRFFWDPEDVRDPQTHEYGIYNRPRHDDNFFLVATAFRKFVLDICLGKKLYNWEGEVEMTFRPAATG